MNLLVEYTPVTIIKIQEQLDEMDTTLGVAYIDLFSLHNSVKDNDQISNANEVLFIFATKYIL